METAKDEPQLLSPKELVVLIPLIGTAIAMSYDVGYFWGIDINLFTLFSVTEHIVFALQAAPFALGVAFVLVVLVSARLDVAVGTAVAEVGRRQPG